jgi:hypothetical protein
MPKMHVSGAAMRRAGFAAVAAFVAFTLSGAPAAEANPQVNQACKSDYRRLCAATPPNHPQTRRCMEVKRRSLSRPCVNALASAGMIPRKYMRELKR